MRLSASLGQAVDCVEPWPLPLPLPLPLPPIICYGVQDGGGGKIAKAMYLEANTNEHLEACQILTKEF